MVLWGRSVLGRQEVPRKVPQRFRKVPARVHLGSTKVLNFAVSLVLSGRSVLGCQKVPPTFQQGSTKALQVSWCLWFSGADPSWAAKRFRGRFHQGSSKGVPRFHQGSSKGAPRFTNFAQVSWCLWLGADPFWAAKRFRLKRCCGRFTKVPPRFNRGSTKVSPRLRKFRVLSGVVAGRFWGAKRFCGRFPHHFFKL